jgi:hypothetical protein
LFGITVADKGTEGIGRLRLSELEDASQESFHIFVQNIAQLGSITRTGD